MKPKYRIEEVTTTRGEIRYRIWQINLFGFKKMMINEYSCRLSAEILIDNLRAGVIVKKKWIDY